MQLPFHFCETKKKAVVALDWIFLVARSGGVAVRSAGAFFFFLILGTAVLFEPLTASLVDLDQ